MYLIPETDVAVAKTQNEVPETTRSQLQSKAELKNKPKEKSSISPSKKAEFRQSRSGDSPIPQRAKFIRKFGAQKVAAKEKKQAIKTSSSKVTAGEGGKKSEKKLKKSGSKEKESKEKRPRERKVFKTKAKQVPKQKQESDSKSKKQEEPAMTPNRLETQALVSDIPQSIPTSSYEMGAETLAETLVKETISTQGEKLSSCSVL